MSETGKRKMILKYLVGAASIASLFPFASIANASITYTGMESFDGATVDLSITTDGALGVLGTGDVTNWNIGVTDSSASIDMTPANSQVLVEGTVFTATSTALSFNFNTGLGGLVLFEIATIGDSGPYWCATNGGCYPHETPPAIGVSTVYGESPNEQTGLSGPTVIATSGAVPEPSTWAMMLLGFAGLGFAGYRTSRKTVAAAA
jgi:hypothetical protein